MDPFYRCLVRGEIQHQIKFTASSSQVASIRYNIEPFFFSSSLNWIPSRFQEDVRPKEGDRKLSTQVQDLGLKPSIDVTITLTFLSAMDDPSSNLNLSLSQSMNLDLEPSTVIDTQAPLRLETSQYFFLSFNARHNLVIFVRQQNLIPRPPFHPHGP